MAVKLQSTDASATAPSSTSRPARLTGGGTSGNEILTAATGAMLIVLLAALGVTILRVKPLLSEHMFIGLLLIPPVMLKMATTGYRFARYYTGNPEYRRKGPPTDALRMLAPLVIASTVAVFATGVVLLVQGPSSRGTWLGPHKAAFIIWVAVTGLHVLAHLPEMPRLLRADYKRPVAGRDVNGRAGRAISLAGALTLGVVLAVVLIPQFSPWLNTVSLFSDH
jgi:hypothetical protein